MDDLMLVRLSDRLLVNLDAVRYRDKARLIIFTAARFCLSRGMDAVEWNDLCWESRQLAAQFPSAGKPDPKRKV